MRRPTRYEKFMSLPRWLRIVIVAALFVPSWVVAQWPLLCELVDETKGLVR